MLTRLLFSRSMHYKFEFCVDSGFIENESLVSYRFAVLDEKEALAWVAAFESVFLFQLFLRYSDSNISEGNPGH